MIFSIIPRLLCIFLILISLTSQSPAQKQRGDPPVISVVTDSGITLLYDMGLNTWNGADFNRTATDAFLYMRQSGASIPSVPLGDTIRITFDGDPPDVWALFDRIDGIMHGRQVLDISFIGNTAAFTLEAFPDNLMQYSDTKHGVPPDLRTFLLVCAWGDNSCEYAFGFSTD